MLASEAEAGADAFVAAASKCYVFSNFWGDSNYLCFWPRALGPIVELVVELHEWDAAVEYDRLGFDDEVEHLLDVAVPKLKLPVRPGRNIATLIEVAARNQLLKAQGIHLARAFRDHLEREAGLARERSAAPTPLNAGGVSCADCDRHGVEWGRQEHGAAGVGGYRVHVRR